MSAREILIVGLNHRTAAQDCRSAMAFAKDDVLPAVGRLRAAAGVEEAMILSTCNRVELYASGDPSRLDAMAAYLLKRAGLEAEPAGEPALLYRLSGQDAVRHAFQVAAGLDSMVVGETQILGQLKDAYRVAEAAGTLGGALVSLRDRSLSAAKRARTETGIGRHAVSVSHVAVELARKIFDGLQDRRVVLVGSGKMCRLAALRLVKEGAHVSVVGRTLERAEELARMLGGEALPFIALRDEISRADIVISGTACPETIIQRADVEAATALRGGRPLFLIDIALPRDIDASVRGMQGVFLYDLDDLKGVAETNRLERGREAAGALEVVEAEVDAYAEWKKSRQAVPLVQALRMRGDEIRKMEMEKARPGLGVLSAEQEKALDAVTAAIVNKLLHAPTVQLKEMARDGRAEEHGSLLRQMLGLG